MNEKKLGKTSLLLRLETLYEIIDKDRHTSGCYALPAAAEVEARTGG